MFFIHLHSSEPGPLSLDRATRAIEEDDIVELEKICLINVDFNFDSTLIAKQGVSAPSLALSLIQLMISLSNRDAHGRIRCNSEPCFFFRRNGESIHFSRYNPEDISDPLYRNELSSADRGEVLKTLADSIEILGRVIGRYVGETAIRPDNQVWGALSIINHNPFVRRSA